MSSSNDSGCSLTPAAYTVAATGHRPDKLGGYDNTTRNRLIRLARDWLQENQPHQVISGMALGWDMAWADAALLEGVPVVAAVPFVGQERTWPGASRDAYAAILARCAEVVVVSGGGYSRAAMQARNAWMVDNCHLVVALWNGSPGGTGNCVAYADAMGRPVVNLWSRWVGA